MEVVLAAATRDARILAGEGMDGLIVENFGDTPYTPGRVEAVTVAAMAVAITAVREVAPELSIGVNVLRADTRSAIGLASVTGARFVRTNLLTGALVTDQGIISSDAYDSLRERRSLGAEVSLLADVLSKHAVPLGGATTLELEARAAAYRGLADGLIVSGDETGISAKELDICRTREAVPDRPVLIGSGLNEDNLMELLPLSNGAIIGTALKVDRGTENAVDANRVRRIVKLAHRLGQ
jgi:membrane complex biogenesis BtpA family protein